MNDQSYESLVKLDAEGLRLKNGAKTAAAIEIFMEILRQAPNWDRGNAAHNLAQCYQQLSDFVNARKCYEQALAEWPDYDVFVNNYAIFLANHGSAAEALPYLLRAYAHAKRIGMPMHAEGIEKLIRKAGQKTGLSPEEIEDGLAGAIP